MATFAGIMNQLSIKTNNLEAKAQLLEEIKRESNLQKAELSNLRSLVKRLFVLLKTDSSDVNLSTGAEADRVFAEWVERQEAKKNGK